MIRPLSCRFAASIFFIFFLSAALWAQNTVSQAREKVLGYNSDEKFINFLFITDVHSAGKSRDLRCADACLEHFVSACNESWCDFAAFGGDAFSAYDATHSEALEFLGNTKKYFDRITIPFYTTKGNHDCNGKLTQDEVITAPQYHMLFHNHIKGHPVHFNERDPYGNYFYVDYPREKVRIIVLNYYDSGILQKAGMHSVQLQWLENEALDFGGPELCDKDGHWTIVFFSHFYSQLPGAFWSLIDRFNISYDGKVRIAALIHGDYHRDMHSVSHNINLVGVACGYCSQSQVGTRDEDLFSVFTIDTRRFKLLETRIGRGEDRVFDF